MNILITIINYLAEHWSSKPGDIAIALDTHRVAVQSALKKGMAEWYIIKMGSTPHVLYDITSLVYDHNIILPKKPLSHIMSNSIDLNFNDQQILNTFYKVNSDGTLLTKKEWCIRWCMDRWFDPHIFVQKYITLYKQIESMKTDCGVIDVTQKFAESLHKKTHTMYLDKALYMDRYTYDEFGRWPLAEMTFFAKQSQDINLINQVLEKVIDHIECLIHTYHIDAIAVTPRSLDRKVQLLDIVWKKLEYLNLPFVHMYKYYPWNLIVTQKSQKWSARFTNAMSSIQIWTNQHYNTILLIDDFVWSWATLNISAMKLKNTNTAKKVIGVSIVGNIDMKYDIINEI